MWITPIIMAEMCSLWQSKCDNSLLDASDKLTSRRQFGILCSKLKAAYDFH